ncbi:MAG: hypothetical protein H6631_12825 [Anaerolineaceae bacterium]|nr:hypothetical protein [Anaerolineaceae bacterium]
MTILYPDSQALLSGRQTISWQTDDSDGDRLSYDIFYSFDGGQTWLPPAVFVN